MQEPTWLEDLRNFEYEELEPIEYLPSSYFVYDQTGVKRSEEFKKNLSEAQTGDKNSFYGKKHTEETKRKMREAQSKVNRSGKNNPMTKHTPEAKEKMRLAWERRRAKMAEKQSATP